MVTPICRRASTIFKRGLPHTPARPSPGRGRHSAVGASFSLPIGQCAVGDAEVKCSRVGPVLEHRRSRPPSKWLTLQSFGTKDGLSVIEMLSFLVFGVRSELQDDTRTVEGSRMLREYPVHDNCVFWTCANWRSFA